MHDLMENYNHLPRKLWKPVTEGARVVAVVALQRPAGLEVGSIKVIVKSLAQDVLTSSPLVRDRV